MERDEPSLSELERLAGSADVGDRAFAASALLLHRNKRGREHDRDQLARVYGLVRETALKHHAKLRTQLRDGSLDAPALLARLRDTPLELRDHLLEEMLDLAYPPLEALTAEHDVTRASPSGLSEILFLLEQAQLGPDKVLVDLGSGFGKVVLLTTLLSGAHAHGIDLDPRLVAHAQGAAHSLQLERAHFMHGDIRTATLPVADVYYMFIPFLRSAEVITRLEPIAAERKLLLFSQALDVQRLPWLRRLGAASYWLEMYETT